MTNNKKNTHSENITEKFNYNCKYIYKYIEFREKKGNEFILLKFLPNLNKIGINLIQESRKSI